MKNYVPQPTTEDAPRLEMVVAVPSLTPEYGLMCLQPVDGYPAGYIHRLYGANLTRPRFYIPGTMPSVFRSALEPDDYPDDELLMVSPLPELIAEIDPADYPKCFQLVILDGEVMPKPVYEEYRQPECKVIQHPATFFAPVRLEKPASKRKPETDPAQQCFPFAEPAFKPNQLSA